MRLATLNSHIERLSRVRPSASPCVSLYCSFDRGISLAEIISRGRATFEGRDIPAGTESDFKGTIKRILEYLDRLSEPRPASVAVYARGGDSPFFQGLRFHVPFPDRLIVGSRPDIYHLIEARERYHRYLALVLNHREAHLLEVELGAIVSRIPVLREGISERGFHLVSAEDSGEVREESTEEWFGRCFRALDRMITDGGFDHLILAGNSHLAWELRHWLPYRLSVKFLDMVDTSEVRSFEEIVAITTDAYVQRRGEASLAMVNELFGRGAPDGSLVTGFYPTRVALRSGRAEVLLLSTPSGPDNDLRGKLVLAAQRRGCRVALVDYCSSLRDAGGVGCILRPQAPPVQEQHEHAPATP